MKPQLANTSKLCVAKGCTNKAEWQPTLMVLPPMATDPKGEHPLPCVIDMLFCAACKDRLKAGDFLSDAGKTQIEISILKAGGMRPSWKRTTLQWNHVTRNGDAPPPEDHSSN